MCCVCVCAYVYVREYVWFCLWVICCSTYWWLFKEKATCFDVGVFCDEITSVWTAIGNTQMGTGSSERHEVIQTYGGRATFVFAKLQKYNASTQYTSRHPFSSIITNTDATSLDIPWTSLLCTCIPEHTGHGNVWTYWTWGCLNKSGHL